MALNGLDLSRDYFMLFEQPRGFELDTAALDRRYRELQSLYHPDRHAAAEARDRRLAVQASTWVNEAYETLRRPERRARYLLELGGIAFDDERDTTAEPAFLMHQMELRESLDEAAHADDPLTALDDFMGRVRGEREKVFGDFRDRYADGDLMGAKRTVLQLRFYERLLDEARSKAERLEDLDG